MFFFPSLCLSPASAVICLSSAPSDSADVESLGRDSSEDEEREEEKRKAEVTSMDEALRTVTGTADHSQEDFLRQNFETLAESCSMGRTGLLNFKGMMRHFCSFAGSQMRTLISCPYANYESTTASCLA